MRDGKQQKQLHEKASSCGGLSWVVHFLLRDGVSLL